MRESLLSQAFPGLTIPRVGIVAGMSLIHGFQWQFGVWAGRSIFAAVLGCLELAAGVFCASFPALVLVLRAEATTRHRPAISRFILVFLALLVGAAAFAALLALWNLGHGYFAPDDGRELRRFVGQMLVVLTVGGAATLMLVLTVRQHEIASSLHTQDLERIEWERQMAEAVAQRLQSQIEPHFIFNTLANAKTLLQQDPSEGRKLLGNLAAYLRVAVAHKGTLATVAEEVALARAYLQIFEVRMGQRLRVRFDVAPDVLRASVPPLMLGTLIENAIKHGVGPRAAGGSIHVAIGRVGDELVARVVDDGAGFHGDSGAGIGLANVRARLRSAYGDRAELTIRNRAAGGVAAAIRLPLRVDA